MTPALVARRNRSRIILAFAAVYVIWGSTYLFIKYAIETIPPFILGGTRFLIAGGLLYGLARLRGAVKPTAHDYRVAAITGILMLGAGNGAVMWAEKTVASGIVALIVSMVPIWVVVLDWLRPRGERPQTAVFFGLALGLAGMIVLIGPGAIIGQGHVDSVGTLVLLVGCIAWATGTLITRSNAKRSASPLMFSSLQMLAAGIAMSVTAVAAGEPARFELASVSLLSALSWVYLVLAGSIVGYTAYVYLLGVVTADKAATYAYVNPIIAVILGWLFANEPIGWRTVAAAAIVLAGVAIINTARARKAAATGEHPLPTRPISPPRQERTAA